MSLVRPEIDAMEDSPILEVWRLGVSQPGVIGLWAGEPDSPPAETLPAAHAGPYGPSGRKHEVDGIPFYEDATLQGYYEVWSGTVFVGSIERIGGSFGPAKMFGAKVRASIPEYRGTRDWDGGSFISKDIYSAVRRLWSEWQSR